MGSKIGVLKIAAGRLGLPIDEYLQKTNDGLKWCHACRTWKTSNEFTIDRSRSSGLSAICADCKSQKHRRQFVNGAPSKKIQSQASSMVSYAVKRGLLKRASELPCIDCGNQADHYHHYAGYEKERWMDVIPLCRRCHRKRHYEQAA